MNLKMTNEKCKLSINSLCIYYVSDEVGREKVVRTLLSVRYVLRVLQLNFTCIQCKYVFVADFK